MILCVFSRETHKIIPVPGFWGSTYRVTYRYALVADDPGWRRRREGLTIIVRRDKKCVDLWHSMTIDEIAKIGKKF
jgi:hypothetical protein